MTNLVVLNPCYTFRMFKFHPRPTDTEPQRWSPDNDTLQSSLVIEVCTLRTTDLAQQDVTPLWSSFPFHLPPQVYIHNKMGRKSEFLYANLI